MQQNSRRELASFSYLSPFFLLYRQSVVRLRRKHKNKHDRAGSLLKHARTSANYANQLTAAGLIGPGEARPYNPHPYGRRASTPRGKNAAVPVTQLPPACGAVLCILCFGMRAYLPQAHRA